MASSADLVRQAVPRAAAFAPDTVEAAARGAALLGAAALAFAGMRRGGIAGGALALAGGALAATGLAGDAAVRAAAERLPPARRRVGPDSPEAVACVTVARPAEDVWRLLTDMPSWPRFMEHLEGVEPLGGPRHRWTVRGPAGSRISWEADTVQDEPGRRLSWRSVGPTPAPNAGWIRLDPAPGGRGTEVRAHMRYEAPGGRWGAAAAAVAGRGPGEQLREGLRRLKSILETGRVPTVEGQPHGSRSRWSVAR
jgi:uncharacterized membrane protein